jgi:hypothetical protein
VDILDIMRLRWSESGIQKRIQALSNSLVRKSGSATRKRVMSAGFLACSCVFGIWANDIAQIEAKMRWAREHPPSVRVIDFALGSRGLRKIEDTDQIHRVVRLIPTHLDENGAFWLSSNGQWVAFFSDSIQSNTIHIYCSICNRTPQGPDWRPFGVGWEALENVTDEIDQKTQNVSPIQRSKKVVFKDPRELSY